MIVVLNFCHHDRDQALKLLKWSGVLQCGKRHDIILHFSQQVRRTDVHLELEEEAKKHWLSVSMASPTTEEERGWPYSPNHGWMSALQLIREKIMKPWLWLEPDAVFLTGDCLDLLDKEHARVNPEIDPKSKNPPKVFPFMGAEVTSPAHRMSGVAVYPPSVVTFLQKRKLIDLVADRGRGMGQREEAFDSYFAPEWLPNCHFTPLIQQIHWTSPDVEPTFPDQASLSLLDPRAVLFHRCKDGTLIDRLREKLSACVSGLNVSVDPGHSGEQERGALPVVDKTTMPGALPSAGSSPAAESNREAELEAELARLRAEMAAKNFEPAPFPQGMGETIHPSFKAAADAKKAATSAKLKAAWERRKAKAAKKAERAARKAQQTA